MDALFADGAPPPLLGIGVVVVSYLVGGIPWGVIIARVTGGPDPRTFGSGRTGGANVMRALGPKAALVSGVLDLLKGTVAVLLARWVGGGPWLEVAAAIAAIVGHTYSPFLGWKGGRGVATGWGALLVISPLAALGAVPVFVGLVLLTGYSSLGSLIGSLTCGILLFGQTLATDGPTAYLVYAVVGTALIWAFHRDNIERLLTGTERRIEWRRTGPAASSASASGAAPPGDEALRDDEAPPRDGTPSDREPPTA